MTRSRNVRARFSSPTGTERLNTFTAPSVVVVIGYCVSFWALSQVVRMMPLGIAYAIWSGMGIVIVSAAAYFIYHQKLDLPAVIGMALIIAGVLVINLFSESSVH